MTGRQEQVGVVEGLSPGVADSREVGTLVANRMEGTMGKVDPEELRSKAVELYRLDPDATYAQIGRDLGVSGEAVRNWVRQADRDQGRVEDGGLSSAERDELVRLRREKVQLEKETRILKAATAYFAQDQL